MQPGLAMGPAAGRDGAAGSRHHAVCPAAGFATRSADALDIVIAVLIGSNLSRTLTGGAPLGPSLVATALLILLHAAFAHLAARVPALGRLMKGRAVQLVRDGEIDEAARVRTGVGDRDLEQALRQAGHTDVSTVESAWLERNGAISVIERRTKPPHHQPPD